VFSSKLQPYIGSVAGKFRLRETWCGFTLVERHFSRASNYIVGQNSIKWKGR